MFDVVGGKRGWDVRFRGLTTNKTAARLGANLASTIEASHLPTWIPLMASNVVQVVAAVAGLAEANIRPAGIVSVRRGTYCWEHRQCRFKGSSIDSPRSGGHIPCRK